ncbi:hypothetical protein CBG60_05470 [Fusobacterium animalis]|uniref:Uncharacterized protein n=1 Tax=Fusobacterium animalis 7_1 TaxID=457405 RepID=A0A140PUR1_9FUSO|nr:MULTISPECIES: hypothetical protein [Fusobacterium]ASG30724.1 hypothetical protein CBG60_05470 [Fusobacterium animalis]EEO43510.2 hypothetical protein FSDG_02069 [Fusobacterium animalis 7_1]EHG19114.2 hypothetical protein HMPREF9369_00691 [Fusobacterium polymorphum F0401]ERT42364.1 hypothetical protein HMPREF1538_00394 [Fusobacterium nucleatum CTI-1]BEO90249.1 hypothetical protein FNCA3_15770 [Fusobacterium nucleatum]
MLPNRLIITKRSKREEIYKNSENKWIIDFEDKIKSWSDFYDIIQKEMDFWNYNEKFRKDDYTYSDIVGDLIIFEKMKERKKEGMVFILDYTENFKKIKDCDKKDYDKSTIYWDLVYNLLVEWYRDNRIMFKEWNASIDIEIYILIDDELIKNKDINFDNELIIATESDRNDVRQQYKNYDKTKIRFFDYDEIKNLPNIFLDNKRGFEAENFIFFYQLEKIKADNSKQLKVEISNSMKIFHVLNIYLLVYIIDKILIEKFIEGKEIKMFMIFANELAE